MKKNDNNFVPPPTNGRFELLFRRPLLPDTTTVVMSWLDVIDEALSRLPAKTEPVADAQLRLQAVLQDQADVESLLERVIPIEEVTVSWLDVIDRALYRLHPAGYTDLVGSAHLLIQEVLQGITPAAQLLKQATHVEPGSGSTARFGLSPDDIVRGVEAHLWHEQPYWDAPFEPLAIDVMGFTESDRLETRLLYRGAVDQIEAYRTLNLPKLTLPARQGRLQVDIYPIQVL